MSQAGLLSSVCVCVCVRVCVWVSVACLLQLLWYQMQYCDGESLTHCPMLSSNNLGQVVHAPISSLSKVQ